ncbi:bifunctional diguanylate cyclase/phosphodiesterase, partial [Propionivibrio sp.]|uniref:bifunctional diguanylate cyclase/phosphodiesterase n=1 Tax=Propionivibrio sp. TaxID=2212460 RepID=UPI003BF3B8C5
MSLHRQLLLSILLSITLAFATSLTITLLAARAFHEEQLAVKNDDNAAALALSMSQLPKDRATIDLQVVSLFETGHYQSIEVVDTQGAVLAKRLAPPSESGAPQWFVRLLPLVSMPGKAPISDGFRQFGTVELKSVADFASLDLYRSAQTLLLVFLVATGVLSGLAVAILGRISKPLQNVASQAQGIIERRYLIIEPPSVPELRTVGEAMNQMVERIQILFAEEARRLDAMRQAANLDELTQLARRSHFMSQLRGALDPDVGSGPGVLVLFRLHELGLINLTAGRAPTDTLIRQAAAIAASHAGNTTQAFAGRLNGSDFALLLPGSVDAQSIATRVDGDLNALPHTWHETAQSAVPLAATAATAYLPGEDIGRLMARLDNALAAAERGNGCVVAAASDAVRPLGSQEWRDKLQRALEQHWIMLAAFDTRSFDGTLMQRECFARLRLDEGGEWLAAGSFLPQLARLKLTADFDLAVAGGLAGFGKASDRLALNLSADSLGVAGFAARLAAIIAAAPGLAQRLSIDVPEQGLFGFPDGFRDLVQQLKALGCRVGADHYGREFNRLGQLQGSGLDYVNIDASFINDVASSPENRSFLKGVCVLCHNIRFLLLGPNWFGTFHTSV